MPSSCSSGVREAPLPVVPGCERMSVRVTLPSYFAGLPYSLMPAPGAFIEGATAGGSTASAPFTPLAARPLAASAPRPRLSKRRVDSSMTDLLAIADGMCELHRQKAAVDRQLDARDVGRLVGGEE